ncbi:hypothetical protein [Paraburkholderia dipogonis]|uniref:hypothetical protein n=1 Tax=Paraburkholderia dipogonis TaxID=1211383 RepID=UPI0038BDEDE0
MEKGQLYGVFIERAAVQLGIEIFLRYDEARQFVSACQNAGMAILGIDGVRIDSRQVMPYIDAIADYSPTRVLEWDEYRDRCNRLALEFLRQAAAEKGADTCFCFEVLDHAEYVDCLKKIAVAR